jgi:hypothetical protein
MIVITINNGTYNLHNYEAAMAKNMGLDISDIKIHKIIICHGPVPRFTSRVVAKCQ